MKKYITTAIPYVNGAPHIGHALDYCLADVFSRYASLNGDEVRFQVGTDEHGNKIFQKAKDLGIPVEKCVDENSAKFRDFIAKLNVSYTDFIRTTDSEHMKRCQEIWRRLAPHIYLAKYEGWYCTGCERFITEKEVTENNGICPDHQKPYDKLEEENYYFRIADFKDRIREAIESGEMEILPDFRKREILKLLEDSPDVSISRPVSQLTWGIPVPDDENQVMYVWIDALSNYLTVLGYPDNDISDYWPPYAQFVGKDILRFHAVIWPAMLFGLGLPLPKTLISHGMVLADGQKMSKSVGNVVEPIEVIEKHGIDAFRYFFLRHIDTFSDSDFTWEKFEDAYNNELANDLGNLAQRVSTLVSKNRTTEIKNHTGMIFNYTSMIKEQNSMFFELMDKFEFSKALDYIWEKIQGLNKKVDDEKPWSLAKNGEYDALERCLNELVSELKEISILLYPFLPETAKKIYEIFSSSEINPPKSPLFPKN